MQFDPDITKLVAKLCRLSYEIGNPYEAVTKVLTNFWKLIQIQHKQELISFLLSSYTSSGNYDEVIDLLSSQSDYKDDRLLQRIA